MIIIILTKDNDRFAKIMRLLKKEHIFSAMISLQMFLFSGPTLQTFTSKKGTAIFVLFMVVILRRYSV